MGRLKPERLKELEKYTKAEIIEAIARNFSAGLIVEDLLRDLEARKNSEETIKTSPNVEFDVIYADDTRHHVAEGVLFEVRDNKLTFHNGTDRPAALIGVVEAAAEVVGAMGLNESERALIIYNIHKRIFGRKDAAADMKINAGGKNNGA